VTRSEEIVDLGYNRAKQRHEGKVVVRATSKYEPHQGLREKATQATQAALAARRSG